MLVLYQKKNNMTANVWEMYNFHNNTIVIVKQIKYFDPWFIIFYT